MSNTQINTIDDWDWWCPKCKSWAPRATAHVCPSTSAVEPEPTGGMYVAYRKQKPAESESAS